MSSSQRQMPSKSVNDEPGRPINPGGGTKVLGRVALKLRMRVIRVQACASSSNKLPKMLSVEAPLMVDCSRMQQL